LFTNGQKPGVSLIILNPRNDAQSLERFLSSFYRENTYVPVELIIASNKPEKSIGEKIKEYIPYLDIKEYTFASEKCTPGLKNLAANKAKYDNLLFATVSVFFTEDLISLMMGQLLDSTIGVVGVGLQELISTGDPGRQKVQQKAGVSFFWDEELKLHKPYSLLIEKDRFLSQHAQNAICPAVNGEFMLCRKKDFALIKGFSEDYYLRFEDVDFCMKMNAQLHKKALCICELSLVCEYSEGMDKDRASKPLAQEYLFRDLKKLNEKHKELLVKHFLAVESLYFNNFLNEKNTAAIMLPLKKERLFRSRENWLRAEKWKELSNKRQKKQTLELPQLSGLSRIGWLQPHLNMAGGIRRAIEMSNRLVKWGAQFYIITPDGHKADWLPMEAEVISFEEALRLNFEVLIISDPECIDMFNALKKKSALFYHLHAYMLYRQKSEKLRHYYENCKDFINIANSRWTADHVENYCGVASAEILPGGVNKEQFHPYISEKIFDTCFFGARKRKIKATGELVNALSGFSRMPLADYSFSQELLAPAISAAMVFVSGSYYEGFNLCPLEAMACGVPVAMTDCGGSREYAVNQENALVVANQDYTALRREVKRLLGDHDLRCHLIEKGMETAWCYSWEQVSRQLAELLVRLKDESEQPGYI